MLLFIKMSVWMMVAPIYFNTSHVTVYPAAAPSALSIAEFQYISCYCLSRSLIWILIMKAISIHLMLLFIEGYIKIYEGIGHFNTSHVTVYRVCRSMYVRRSTFQYISCYCLSVWRLWVDRTYYISIHLMLLFIDIIRMKWHIQSIISIHLMLLFIARYLRRIHNLRSFQYISCYCLSVSKMQTYRKIWISIHLMLLFIVSILPSLSRNPSFQYISCYCLSPPDYATIGRILEFQYISCYCLSESFLRS